MVLPCYTRIGKPGLTRINMKKNSAYFTLALCLLLFACQKQADIKRQYAHFLNAHPFNQPTAHTNHEESPEPDRPDLAWQQNYLATMNPTLGRPTPEKLIPIYERVRLALYKEKIPGSSTQPWVERGPDNVGGRVRAIMMDPNDPTGNKVWAGSVTGGLWYNNNITNPNSSWFAVDDFWDNLAITGIAYDPTDPNIFYASTGEGWFQTYSGTRGAGIWKSTDGGLNWTHLPSTANFYFINDLVVRNENGNGVIYAGCNGERHQGLVHGTPNIGLQRSTDGGATWPQVMPKVPGDTITFAVADLEIAADNRLWVGTAKSSSDANDHGGGRILFSDDGLSWIIARTVPDGERVEIACAPGNANYVYAMTEVGNGVGEIVRTINNGLIWVTLGKPQDADNGIPNNDFSRNQAWYDMALAVDPNNINTVLAGAVDLFRTTDGGNNWEQISKWSNNNNLAGLNCSEVHADQHQIIFKGSNSNEIHFSNDGGVIYTSNITQAAQNDVIFHHSKNLNITQFYGCALHPDAGSYNALAGAQDNGTLQFNVSGLGPAVEVQGGDGAYCFINQNNPQVQIMSYVYNAYWRTNGGGGRRQMQYDRTGRFVNPADYDDNMDVLYSARDTFCVNRITDVSGAHPVDSFIIPNMVSMASHLRVSPYTTTSTTLFVGCENGDVFKVVNAAGNSPTATSIGAALPAGNISCIELGADEDELLVTLSNYGVNSVWYTEDGGTTWSSKEGDLPDMPVRWALFNPNNRSEVILATEVGVWSTSDLDSPSPSWSPGNSGLANVRVDMLQIRDSDHLVIAATHGRGLFESDGFNPISLAEQEVRRMDIFPNPARNNATLSFDHPGEEELMLRVYTTNGTLMLQKPLPKIARVEESLNMRSWPVGPYVVQVSGKKTSFSKRIVKR